MNPRSHLALFASFSLALLLGACSSENITVREIPKSASETGGLSVRITESETDLEWSAPNEWEALPSKALRKASYRIPAAPDQETTINVSSYPGLSKRLKRSLIELKNRASLTYGESIATQAKAAKIEIAGLEGRIYSAAYSKNEDERSNKTAIFRYHGNLWIVSIDGPSTQVENKLDSFRGFLASFQPKAPTEEQQLQIAQTTIAEFISFDAPEDWIGYEENNPSRVRSFRIEKEGLPTATVTIHRYGERLATFLSNVSRWRTQLALDPWSVRTTASRNKRIDTENLSFDLFDLMPETTEEKERGSERMLVALTEHIDDTWVIKLRGDMLLLETQQNQFFNFLNSIEFVPTPSNQIPLPSESSK